MPYERRPEESLEAVAVRLSDRIAYINHDVDDAIRAGVITETDIPGIVGERLGDRHSTRINSILTDIISNSSCGKIKMSPGIEEAVGTFHSFMYSDVWMKPQGERRGKKGPRYTKGIFRHYKDHPDKLPDEYKIIAERTASSGLYATIFPG
jgi:dGTPase